MKIQHKKNAEQGTFFVLDEKQQPVAKLTYVSETLRGQGVADKLYQALITFIQENQLKLVPTCSYIAKKWQRHQQHD
ncbi:N-acetyltransferase [Aggregatibacter sp. oral taxon 513]|jgi:acetyltransferase|uniref:GNAT family N-acetyltransferase n=1 Tax=Aggregatibacter TaxID=416916 RepID=UPI001BAAE4C7|nr:MULTISPECIES: N-acetyltransferase [Aggregatibacter]QUC05478.1 N-acetyltransferase [Aggregatibacter sp. oral taxon 513]